MTQLLYRYSALILILVLALAAGYWVRWYLDLVEKGEGLFRLFFGYEFFLVTAIYTAFLYLLRGSLRLLHISGVPNIVVPKAAGFWDVVLPLVLLYGIIALFGAFKSLIPFVNPYSWDPSFIEWERFLHGGILPHDVLVPLVYPDYAKTVDWIYSSWFFVIYIYLIWQICRPVESPGRMRFLLSFALCWLIIGNVLPLMLSSVGPVYYHVFYDGPDPYQEFLRQMELASQQQKLFFITFQELLLKQHQTGGMVEYNGPAAGTSVHIAMVALMLFHSLAYARKLWPFAAIYLLAIFICSMLVGFHYALDGYIGILAMWVIWWGCGLNKESAALPEEEWQEEFIPQQD